MPQADKRNRYGRIGRPRTSQCHSYGRQQRGRLLFRGADRRFSTPRLAELRARLRGSRHPEGGQFSHQTSSIFRGKLARFAPTWAAEDMKTGQSKPNEVLPPLLKDDDANSCIGGTPSRLLKFAFWRPLSGF
jgi:hypothetical protein